MLSPVELSALIADSRPLPGPFTTTSPPARCCRTTRPARVQRWPHRQRHCRPDSTHPVDQEHEKVLLFVARKPVERQRILTDVLVDPEVDRIPLQRIDLVIDRKRQMNQITNPSGSHHNSSRQSFPNFPFQSRNHA